MLCDGISGEGRVAEFDEGGGAGGGTAVAKDSEREGSKAFSDILVSWPNGVFGDSEAAE